MHYVNRSPVITPEMRRAGAEWIIAGFKAQDRPDPEILAQNVFVVMHEAASPPEKVTARTPSAETYHMTPGEQRIMDKALRRSTHLVAPTPPASDLSNAAKAWYTHIAPQPTVHGRIQGLAAVLAEAVENAHHERAKYAAAIIDQAKAEQHTVDVAALRYTGFTGAADFLEQRK